MRKWIPAFVGTTGEGRRKACPYDRAATKGFDKLSPNGG